jgi:hypothetical protein
MLACPAAHALVRRFRKVMLYPLPPTAFWQWAVNGVTVSEVLLYIWITLCEVRTCLGLLFMCTRSGVMWQRKTQIRNCKVLLLLPFKYAVIHIAFDKLHWKHARAEHRQVAAGKGAVLPHALRALIQPCPPLLLEASSFCMHSLRGSSKRVQWCLRECTAPLVPILVCQMEQLSAEAPVLHEQTISRTAKLRRGHMAYEVNYSPHVTSLAVWNERELAGGIHGVRSAGCCGAMGRG